MSPRRGRARQTRRLKGAGVDLDDKVPVLGFPRCNTPSSRSRRLFVLAAAVVAAMAGGIVPASPQSSGRAWPGDTGVFVRYFAAEDLFPVLGEEVKSAAGADMGRIVDVLADEKGRPRAAVIDFGGFLGVGTRKIAVAWRALCFSGVQKRRVVLPDLTPDQLKSAPEYEAPEKPIAVITPLTLIGNGSDPCPRP
ncbi:MAG: PRC-barrel domain-containing protein [Stellaceae bacterium]